MNKTLRKGFTTLLIAMVLLIAFLPNIAQAENGLTLEKSHAWSTDGESYTNAVAARDIDNDGITEMVTVGYFHNSTTDYYDGEMNIWSWNGTELTSEHNEYFHPEYTTSNDTHFNAVALSNVDNDTDIEVIGAGYGNFLFVISLFPIPKFVFQEQGFLFVGNWNGSSLTRKAFTRWPDNENETTRFLDLAVGDVDKDNVVEIVAVGYRNMTGPAGFHGVITIWNITEGNFVLEASYEKMISGETIWRSVSINDVDDDGELEIVIVGDFYDKNLKQRCATLRICTWDGSTLDWELGYQWYTYSETYANAVTTGDIDEDGIPEIITIGYHANGEIVNAQLRVWSWKQEVLTLKANVESGRIEPPAITFGTAVAIGDVDSDGKNEIVVGVNFWIIYWSRAHIKIFSWNGETLATEESKDWEEASYIQSIVIDDVDNDAKAEIVTAGFTAGLMIVPQSNLGIWSISKVSSSITVAVEPSSIVIGEQVTISGRVTNETGDVPIPNVEVRIEYSREPMPVFVYLATVVTDENGEYTFTWIPPAPGAYSIMVGWNGDYEHEGATATTTLTVEKASSMITLTLSSYTITLGEEISISGTLYPAKEATIFIEYTNPEGIIPITKTVNSNEAGFFSTTFTANQTGTWTIKAKWDGDETYKAAESPPATLTVTKIPSALTITASALTVNVNENVTITGTLTPAQMATITLTYIAPNGTTVTRTVASNDAGTFTDIIKLDRAGVWQVKASWNGNEEYEAAESALLTLTAQTVDPFTQTLAVTGFGLGLIALILALLGVYMALRKKPGAPPPAPTPTSPTQ